MKKSVLLLADEPGIALQVLFCLEELGAITHVLASPRAQHLRWARGTASIQALDVSEPEDLAATAAAIDRRAWEVCADLVVPTGIASTRTLIDLKPYLRTPTYPLPSRQQFRMLDDKYQFSRALRELGLPTPKTQYVGEREHINLDQLARDFGFPLVIKPTNEGNSNGVVIVSDADDARRKVIDNPNYPYRSLIAQEYIPGFDVDLSVLAVKGHLLAWGVQRRIGRAIHFLPDETYVDVGRRIIAATSYSGPAHFDARFDTRDGTVKLIECNPRFWASITASLRCGLNYLAEGIAAVDGETRQPVALEHGVFLSPLPFVASLLRAPWRRELWSRPNLGALGQVCRNLQPFLWEEWTARRRQVSEWRRRGGAGRPERLRMGKG